MKSKYRPKLNNDHKIYLLFFFSGAIGLVYEVLWLKQLGVLFGNTTYATSMVLTVFFFGISTGNYFWGNRVSSYTSPLRLYGLLEIGIGITALCYFLLFFFYREFYPALIQILGDDVFIGLMVKILLSLTLIFPVAFCLGGTFPAIVHHFVIRSHDLAKYGIFFYALNTCGAILGTFSAGGEKNLL